MQWSARQKLIDVIGNDVNVHFGNYVRLCPTRRRLPRVDAGHPVNVVVPYFLAPEVITITSNSIDER